jgi:rubrerythrin
MELNTASQVISFAKKLEEDGARLYEGLAHRCTEDKETLISFAQENRKSVIQIERAYYGVITDALEGGFSFKVNPENYIPDTELDENASYFDILGKAIKMEEKTVQFYIDAAEQSKSLLADVPRAFLLVAKKRSRRIPQLKSLTKSEPSTPSS